MILAINYDLRAPGQAYETIHAYIEANADDWLHVQGSVWFVDTLHSPSAWADGLTKVTDTNDEIIVARLDPNTTGDIGGGVSWEHYPAKVTDWFNASGRRW